MTATGESDIPLGLIWGWHLLSPHLPFKDGASYDTENVTKFVILMTDGENTFNDVSNSWNMNNSNYTALGYIWQKRLGNTIANPSAGARTDLMDARLAALCKNMTRKPANGAPKTSNAPDIQLYTIRVEVAAGTSTILRDCASDPSMYYDVANSADLTAVFNRIGEEIKQLRLAK
jgi:hypothetical protein